MSAKNEPALAPPTAAERIWNASTLRIAICAYADNRTLVSVMQADRSSFAAAVQVLYRTMGLADMSTVESIAHQVSHQDWAGRRGGDFSEL